MELLLGFLFCALVTGLIVWFDNAVPRWFALALSSGLRCSLWGLSLTLSRSSGSASLPGWSG